MRTLVLFFWGFSFTLNIVAQRIVTDYQHALTVNENGAIRSSAEAAHFSYLGRINTNINDLNTNIGSVVLAQNIIYQALANVDGTMKNGLEVKNMTVIINDMTDYINQAITMAKGDPYLLLFTDNLSREMKTRAFALVGDVSGYILKHGSNVLADYNSRDQLLREITQQLEIIDGLAYGAWKSMYWAKERGLVASLNPFAGYVSRDKAFVLQIIRDAKYLRQ